jgi:hypothetical protein
MPEGVRPRVSVVADVARPTSRCDTTASAEPAVPRAAGFLSQCPLWVISALFPQHRFMSALPPTTRREQGRAERSRINHVEAAHLGMTHGFAPRRHERLRRNGPRGTGEEADGQGLGPRTASRTHSSTEARLRETVGESAEEPRRVEELNSARFVWCSEIA